MFPLQLLNSVIIHSAVKQTSTIIFLHGLGDTGQSWAQLLPQIRPPHAKIICPNAPVQNVALYDNLPLTSWFNLRPLDQPKDEFGIKAAAEAINEIIEREINLGIPSSQIVLGGFSQGGAIALYTGLTSHFRLGGILALSTWLPLDKVIPWDSIQKPRVLQCHGDKDTMIALPRALKAAKLLEKALPEYNFKMYKGLGHTVACEKELKDIEDFLEDVLKPEGSRMSSDDRSSKK